MRIPRVEGMLRVLVLLLLGVLPLTSALAAAPPLNQPNAYAVVIGISQYREKVIPKVAYAVQDAEAMAFDGGEILWALELK